MAEQHIDLDSLRREVVHAIEEWQAEHGFEVRCDAWLRGDDSDFSRMLARRGWIGLTWPRDMSGRGASNLARLVVTEELLRVGAPVARHWIADRQIGPAIVRYGSPQLQEEILPGIARGEITFCLGMSETESGSDLASVRTTATEVDGGWQIKGRKIWTSQAHVATHAYVLARTSADGTKHDGLTEFIVPMDGPAVEVRPIYDMQGEHHFNEVSFDQVVVPPRYVLGEVGNGWQQVTEQLAHERGGIERVLSTYPLMSALLEGAAGQVRSDAVEERLGSLYARLKAIRAMAWEIGSEMDAGETPVMRAAMLKDLGTAFEADVTDVARQLASTPADPTQDSVAGLLAQAIVATPGFTIRGGTTEVLRTIIARGVADGLPKASRGSGELAQVADQVLAGHAADPTGSRLPEAWTTACELGWPLVGVPEQLGGVGGELDDARVLIEASGRHASPIPLLGTMVANRVAGGPSSSDPNDAVAAVALPTEAEAVTLETVDEKTCVTGTVDRVPWARFARRFVIRATDGHGKPRLVVVAAQADGLTLSHGSNVAGEPRDRLDLECTPCGHVPDDGPRSTELDLLLGSLQLTRTLGALDRAFELTREHVTVREQFGRALIRFQAVSHTLAGMASDVELARSAVGAAFRSLETADLQALLAVGAAHTVVADCASRVAAAAHQLHGAMGITREHGLHLITRRLWSWPDEWGTERAWTRRLGGHLIGLGPTGAWDWVTAGSERMQEVGT